MPPAMPARRPRVRRQSLASKYISMFLRCPSYERPDRPRDARQDTVHAAHGPRSRANAKAMVFQYTVEINSTHARLAHPYPPLAALRARGRRPARQPESRRGRAERHQSAVSHQLRALESDLGATLLHRGGTLRRAQVTEAGATLLVSVQQALTLLETACRNVRVAVRSKRRHSLNLSVNPRWPRCGWRRASAASSNCIRHRCAGIPARQPGSGLEGPGHRPGLPARARARPAPAAARRHPADERDRGAGVQPGAGVARRAR